MPRVRGHRPQLLHPRRTATAPHLHGLAGEGCESSNFGLCQYPATVDFQGQTLKTMLSGWRWSSFCKTQYAVNPACGGLPHFLQCHLTVIALLDQAKKLGCLAEVDDEGGFWEKRDLPALAEEVGSWNEMLAVLGSRLKDVLGQGVQSEITRFSNFEHLEAAGQSKLPAGFDKLFPLLRRFANLVSSTALAASYGRRDNASRRHARSRSVFRQHAICAVPR